ncbi:MAG: anthranilate phosphoribosyltransferase, partial [Pseudomonadota bacterium]|nr:anthranilate phosphoribosyltransferase [Pseudomonadota bacterium]
AQRQLIGVFAPEWQQPIAEVAQLLGSTHVMVVHANGLDELSITGTSTIVELKDAEIQRYTIEPEDFGITTQRVEDLHANSPERSLELVRRSLSGDDTSGAADIVALNAGAAIYVAGIADTLANGVTMAEDSIASGLAAEKLAELTRVSRLMESS